MLSLAYYVVYCICDVATLTIISIPYGYEVGAITGDARNGTIIDNCSVTGGQIIVTGGGYAGGLVGRVYGKPEVVITDCTVTGTYTKTSGNYSGGLVGYFSGSGSSKNKSVENSYSSGKVTGTGTTEYGAFNGRSGVEYRGTNYYDAERASVARAYGTSGAPIGLAVAYPQGKTTADMMKQSTFEGWDFITVWSMADNETYPFFYAFWDVP